MTSQLSKPENEIELPGLWSLRKLSLADKSEWALQYRGMDWIRMSEFLPSGNSTSMDEDVRKFAAAVNSIPAQQKPEAAALIEAAINAARASKTALGYDATKVQQLGRFTMANWKHIEKLWTEPAVPPHDSALADRLEKYARDVSNSNLGGSQHTCDCDEAARLLRLHSQEESDRQHRIDTSVARQLGTAINRNGQLASALRDLLGATRNLAVDMFLRERCEKALLPSQEEKGPTVDELGGYIEHGLAYGISSKDGRTCAKNLLLHFDVRAKR